jgi:N-acetylneuraminic acid mutarotase
MKVRCATLIMLVASVLCEMSFAAAPRLQKWLRIADLPEPLSNAAVAVINEKSGPQLIVALGIGPGKNWQAVSRRAYALSIQKNRWRRLPDVPGVADSVGSTFDKGRLASMAINLDGYFVLFGGYSVSANAQEISQPNIQRYNAWKNQWEERPGMWPPATAVDDSLVLAHAGQALLVSGWSTYRNVALVQIYHDDNKSQEPRWQQATTIVGPPVFGHAGALAGNVIVYCGGAFVDPSAKPKYQLDNHCYRGEIDPSDAQKIAWRVLQDVPDDVPRYRGAAGAWDDDTLVFVGGTESPYNYNGIAYSGEPAAAMASVWAYHVKQDQWERLHDLPEAVTDLRGLAASSLGLFVVGGMRDEQQVSAHVWWLRR